MKKFFGILVGVILLLLLLSSGVFADFESEPNNKKADANDLPINTSRSGTISDASDEDWYRITVPAEGTLQIDFTYPFADDSQKCWSMRIYQEDGKNYLVDGEYWSYRPNQREDPVKINVKAGTYYIKIADDRYHSSEQYTLYLSYGHDCETHYSQWSAEGEDTHARTCSVCQRKDVAHHTWDEGEITVPSSCTQGSKVYTCTVCSAEKTVDISKHDYGEWQKNDAMTHKQICAACQDTVSEAHRWNHGEITKTPTCEEAGVKTYTCTVCGAQKQDSIPKTTDHAYDAWVENDNTTHQKTCTVCQDLVLDYHRWNGGEVTKTPSCKEIGIKSYTCLACSAQKEVEIPKTTDHRYGDWQGKDSTTHQKICTVCQDTVLNEHQWNDGEITRIPSCKEAGIRTYACLVCAAQKEEEIPKTTDHQYGTWQGKDSTTHQKICTVCHDTVLNEHQWNDGEITQIPSCKVEGKKTYICTICSSHREDILPKTQTHSYGLWGEHDATSHKQNCTVCEKTVYEAHQWDQGTLNQTPSCAEDSIKTYRCSLCCAYQEEKIRLPHEEVQHLAQAPTCTAVGWEAYVTCAHCKYTTYREINALGHSYDPNVWGYAEEAGHGHLCQRENCSSHDTLEQHSYTKKDTCQVCGYRSNTASGCAAAAMPIQTVPMVFPGVALAGVLRKKKSRRS